MFGFKSHQDSVIEQYETIIENQNKQIADLMRQLEDLNANADFAVDFIEMRAFSIERSNNQTVIGYNLTNKSAKEWYLQCSTVQHNRLVEQFEQYLFNKYSKEQ